MVFAAESGDSVSGLSRLFGSELGDNTVEPFGDVTPSLFRLPPFDDEMVEVHCPSGDILLGSQTTISGGLSAPGLCEFTLKVTVKLLLLLF